MALSLKQILIDKFDITPTTKMLNDLNKFCLSYEVRGENPQTLNTPLLAIQPMYFLTRDVTAVFDICGIYKPELEKAIRSCSSINAKWKTVSTAFNILVVWMVYQFLNSKLTPAQKKQGAFILLKLLHYRVFTGRVGRQFPHGADLGVMTATIDNLSNKSDIKQKATGTWKLVIEDHCNKLLESSSLHIRTFETFSPDDKVIYSISDMATRIIAKIVVISDAYYKNHAAGITVASKSATGINSEGERELKALNATMDSNITSLCSTILNTNRLINHSHIKLACALSYNVRPDMLREVLMILSTVATAQYNAGTTQETIMSKQRTKIYVGYRTLVTELVQKTLRRCILEGNIDIKSSVAVLERTRAIYRSSRVNDPDILAVKSSVDYFVQTNTRYQREATLVSIRSALIIYLMISVLSQ